MRGARSVVAISASRAPRRSGMALGGKPGDGPPTASRAAGSASRWCQRRELAGSLYSISPCGARRAKARRHPQKTGFVGTVTQGDGSPTTLMASLCNATVWPRHQWPWRLPGAQS